MTALSDHVEAYLAIRRALGFKLEAPGRLLADFAVFTARAGIETVTIEVALAWAGLPAGASPVWINQRLGVVRQFARYLQTIDAAAEVPPTDLLPGRAHRATPYLYSEADIAALITAARDLPGPLRSATFATLIALLACTGMRGGEAMRLDRDDIDWAGRRLLVRETKFGKSRQLPLHASTLDALREYDLRRESLCPSPKTASFFVSVSGARLCHATVQPIFRRLLHEAGIEERAVGSRPRIHDMRHSFAVATLLGWYRDGQDVQARMPALSTYLGHVDPAATYWYLTAAPELLALAAARLEASFGGPA
ncbi:tyrosine-type recombinase/integrase [Sporichthya sp.]|uniref:tyrosine-type recombinase/integrase n=1 Tax=Sporichthya sp. TaxID=65475 RepID=UPI00178E5EBE|nr:tyrosine-type recombinase/integrase [Sporichthya sp.]MBA3741450.1 tyrosine-type recombinase/integrase [Sporichthya sp.]